MAILLGLSQLTCMATRAASLSVRNSSRSLLPANNGPSISNTQSRSTEAQLGLACGHELVPVPAPSTSEAGRCVFCAASPTVPMIACPWNGQAAAGCWLCMMVMDELCELAIVRHSMPACMLQCT